MSARPAGANEGRSGRAIAIRACAGRRAARRGDSEGRGVVDSHPSNAARTILRTHGPHTVNSLHVNLAVPSHASRGFLCPCAGHTAPQTPIAVPAALA